MPIGNEEGIISMANLQSLLKQGLDLHQQGQLAEAAAIYRHDRVRRSKRQVAPRIIFDGPVSASPVAGLTSCGRHAPDEVFVVVMLDISKRARARRHPM